jgi:hypothetical protein
MSINITPLDQQVHLKQFEPGFGASNYDHSSQPLTGWRAERQLIENQITARKEQNEPDTKTNEPAPAINWIAKIANMFNTPRLAG